MNFWLMKSEPSVFGIDDLQKNTIEYGEELWDGVRNYQARNFLRTMQEGEQAFFYHSNTKVPGIYGLMEVKKTNVVDPTQFNPTSKYFDPKSTTELPRWDTVTVAYIETWAEPITLNELKQNYPPMDYPNFPLVQRGNRLSVIPVPEQIFKEILILHQNKIN